MSDREKNERQKIFLNEEDEDQNNPNQKRSKSTGTYSVEEVRKEFIKAYMPWTAEDDKKLEKIFNEGKSVRELARIFGRKEGAIHSRLRKIGVVDNA